MTKRGNWGDWAVIDYPNEPRRISCETCVYYYKDDKSCPHKGLYIPSVGFNYWLTCNSFILDKEFSSLVNDRCRHLMQTKEYKEREAAYNNRLLNLTRSKPSNTNTSLKSSSGDLSTNPYIRMCENLTYRQHCKVNNNPDFYCPFLFGPNKVSVKCDKYVEGSVDYKDKNPKKYKLFKTKKHKRKKK